MSPHGTCVSVGRRERRSPFIVALVMVIWSASSACAVPPPEDVSSLPPVPEAEPEPVPRAEAEPDDSLLVAPSEPQAATDPSPEPAPPPEEEVLPQESPGSEAAAEAPDPSSSAMTEADPITGSPAAFQEELQEGIEQWFGYWQRGYSSYMRISLGRMARFGDLVDAAIEERGLPYSLRYLPIPESYYNPRAYSRAGAAGMWQFMAPTARERGLLVNRLLDERRDPVVATEAALDMLAELYERFDSWFLALAAYNGGPNRMSRILRQHARGTLSDSTFLEVSQHLPRETREFIPKFLAAAAIAENPEAYGFHDITPEPVFAYDEVTLPDAISLDVVARFTGVSEDEIRALNPHLPLRFLPGVPETALRLPEGSRTVFEQDYATLPSDQRMTIVEHTITSGETLSHIADIYGVPLPELIATNPGLRPRYLRIGQKVMVPRLVMARD